MVWGKREVSAWNYSSESFSLGWKCSGRNWERAPPVLSLARGPQSRGCSRPSFPRGPTPREVASPSTKKGG